MQHTNRKCILRDTLTVFNTFDLAAKAKNIFIPVLISFGILIVLEIASRIILSRVYDRRFDASLVEENKYGSTSGLKANATGTVWGKAFHTDEMGGRRQSNDRKGKRKMLFIGDSVTEGVGVEDSQTYADLISQMLPADRQMDVRNISLTGWSTADYRHALDSILIAGTDVRDVVLFYCINDIYGQETSAQLPHMGKTGISGAVTQLLQNNCAAYKLAKLFVYQHADKYYQYDQALYHDTARVRRAAADLKYIDRLCDERGCSLLIMLLPYRSQLEGKNPAYPQQVISAALGSAAVVHDLTPDLKKESDPGSLYLFGDEIHFSAKGHQAIARLFTGK